MSELIISVSGLRGIVGETLSPNVVINYAAAFAQSLEDGPIVVTRDGRATGRMLADAVCSALCAMGRTVLDAGIAATPSTGVLVRKLHAAGGIQISASHNPPEYNGLKLFSHAGRVINAKSGEAVKAAYTSGNFAWAKHEGIGATVDYQESTAEHLQFVLATVDVEAIRAKAFHVLLDANQGAGSILGRELLSALGCEPTVLGGDADGQFEHPAEPTADNLVDVARTVADSAAIIGFCQDPDADRLAVIDENGRYLGEEYTLALCLDHVLSTRQGAVVTNCATSRMSQDIAEKHGCEFHVAPVGEANVVDQMLAHDAVFGGEGNGGPIDPRVGYVRDSFVGMALILDAMAARDMPVSALADELPRYAIHKTKVQVARDEIPVALDRMESHFTDATANRMDGLRLDWPDRWLLVRASNTEPIVRLIAEADSPDAAVALCDAGAKVILAK